MQLLGTWTRPIPSIERLRRYGKRVTVQLPFQPPFVILSDPAEIKELFTADPEAGASRRGGAHPRANRGS